VYAEDPAVGQSQPSTLHPTLYTLHPASFSLNHVPAEDPAVSQPQPYTLHATSSHAEGVGCTLRTPLLVCLNPAPYALYPAPYTLHPASFTLNSVPAGNPAFGQPSP